MGECARLAGQPLDVNSIAASEFTFDSPYISALAELREYARPTFTPGRPLREALEELTRRIHGEFKYQPKSTSIDTPLLEVLAQAPGCVPGFCPPDDRRPCVPCDCRRDM